MTTRILRVREVASRLGICPASVWYKANPKNRRHDPDFPQPFKVSANATGWLESEINDYIAKLAEKRLITKRSKGDKA